MDDKNFELLNDEIASLLENLNETEAGSDEYLGILKDLEPLYKLRLEEIKMMNARTDNDGRRDLESSIRFKELEIKEEQLTHEIESCDIERRTKNRQSNIQTIKDCAKMGIEIAGIVLPLMFYASWMQQGLEFEKTGSFTSSTFKGLFQKFKPTGK